MIAYKEKLLDRLLINQQAAIARDRHLISHQEYIAVQTAHQFHLYSPNIFIRIGLFIITVVIVLMSYGLLFLISGSTLENETTLFVTTLIFGCSIYVSLEWMIQRKKHYRSGVDDALLWLSFITIVVGIAIYFDLPELPTSILIFVLSFAASLRFANAVMSAVTFSSFIAILFYGLSPAGASAKTILPFVTFLISVAIYVAVLKIKHRHVVRHYHQSLLMLEVLSLVTVYAAVNYFVVRELSILLFDLHLPQHASIAGGWFFWICTFTIPALYIARGLQVKDRVILRVGLLLIAATIFTFKYYYTIAPIEQMMTAGGIILIVLAYVIIRYLQTPKHGVSDKSPYTEINEDGLNVESLVVAETFQVTPAPQEGFNFGGGTTGGGGASGQF